VLDLLAQHVGPEGEAIGIEREPHLIALGEALLAQRGLHNARFVRSEVYATGCLAIASTWRMLVSCLSI
jgi:hypothetical protein